MLPPLSEQSSDPQICRQCRGRCCQGHPGLWVDPQRFLAIFDLPAPATPADLQARLAVHNTLELRKVDGVPIPAPRQTDGGCIFLDEHGCRLRPAERPCQCRALVPVLDTLLDEQILCFLPPHASTLNALRNWRRLWTGR